MRTYADLRMIQDQGSLESSIVSRNSAEFQTRLGGLIASVFPLAITNNLLKYALQELQMRCRSRLTKHLLRKYMAGQAFYHITAVDGRISNPEQLLTSECLPVYCLPAQPHTPPRS